MSTPSRRGAGGDGGDVERADPPLPTRRVSRPALVLLVLSLLAVPLAAVAAGPDLARGGPGDVLLVVGVPLACGLLALVVERRTRGVLGSAGVVLCGLVLLGWATLLFLGIGFGLFPAALLLLAAGVVSADHRLRVAGPR